MMIQNYCQQHGIRYADLVDLVRRDINALLARSDQDMDALAREAVRRMGSEESVNERKRRREQAEARLAVTDKMVAKLYLDNAEGRIDDDRLRRLPALEHPPVEGHVPPVPQHPESRRPPHQTVVGAVRSVGCLPC